MSKIGKIQIKRIWHKWFGVIISVLICLCLFVINKFITINVMICSNITNVLGSTITFTSIVLGLSGTLIGQVINAKNAKNDFVIWYFNKVDKSTFVFNIFASIISAFFLIGTSIFLLSYDMLIIILRRIITCLWTISLSSFIIYQSSNYKLFLDILFFKPEIITATPKNVSDIRKNEIFNQSKNKHESDIQGKECYVDSLIDKS